MPLLGDDLAAWWDLDDEEPTFGGDTLTNVGSTPFASALNGNGAVFTGLASGRDLRLTAAEASAAGIGAGDTTRTYGIWVNLSAKTEFHYYLSQYLTTGDQRAFFITYNNSTDLFNFIISPGGLSSGNTFIAHDTFGSPSTDTWYLLTLRFDTDANIMRVGVNTSFKQDSVTAMHASTGDFVIGSNDLVTAIAQATIDSVFVFNRYLSDDEITALVNSGTGRFPTAAGVFPLTARVDAVGSGADYATLSAWQTARKVNLVQQNAYAIARCLDNTAGTLTVTTGWAATERNDPDDPTSGRCLTIQGPTRYVAGGVYDSGNAGVNHGASVGLTLQQANTWVEGLTFTSTGASSVSATATGCHVEHCISDGANNAVVVSGVTGYVAHCALHGGTNCLNVQNASGVLNAYFNVLTCSSGNCFNVGTGATLNENGNYGHSGSGAVYAGVGTINQGAASATSNTEATTAELDSIPHSTATFANVSDGTEDYHLVGGSALLDVGPDITGLTTITTTDLVGVSRPQGDESDIGALETPVAAEGTRSLLLLGAG